ncbi:MULTISPECIES: alpha/beta fold hydrolase [Cyanophyceae]|uniref:alpha/beta fold hydrolase n=1 Tax=Cyanophyceae TaxID=3028117 RepID=UPI0016826800|nr:MULTISPECIES: alpha/beta fold hydrolase [unclassified Phormidium]MBD1914681.1 alpha/beta fold hydrolase [Phormidium sp. FACHB-77]MBD2032569.1 alpha/beta fold hydrolase [Phormidium sp. FACHB-322]MBD2049427.1 alpha/beta fold hydrolase [Leptolyngbya sp. FACHB-60]
MEPNVREQRIDINGLTIHYYESATAEGQPDIPLVLLHGTGESAFDWNWVLPDLCSQYRVYAPSFPGAGESSKPNRAYSIDFLTRFVLDFLSALNLEQAILVGNSLGGLVSLRMALNYPEKVAALVLVDSAGLGPYVNPLLTQMTLPVYGEVAIAWSKLPVNAQLRVRARTTLMYANPQKAPDDWLAMQDKLTQTPGFLEATLSSLRALSNIFGQHIVLLDDLPQLTMPTLLIWGENDLILPKYQAQAAVKRIPQGQLSIIPQAGHLPQIEQPDLFLAALKPFLTRVYTEA